MPTYDYEVPVPDPYMTERTILKKNQKSTLHLTRMFDRMEHARDLMNMRLAITNQSIETVRSVMDQSSLLVKEVTHRAVMTAQLELGMISGRKRKIITKGKGADKPKRPPAKLPTQKSPITKPRRPSSPDLNEAFCEEFKTLTNRDKYYEPDSDNDDSYPLSHHRHVQYCDPATIPLPQSVYMPDFDDISDTEMDFTENHQIEERPSEPAAEHDHGSPADRTWQLLPPVQEPHMSPSASECQNEGPMWDSACLVDPTSNETRSVYYRSFST